MLRINKKSSSHKISLLILASILLLSIVLTPQGTAKAAAWCECVKYIQNRYKLLDGIGTGGAKTMGAYLSARGFSQVTTPQVGAVVIFQPAFGNGINSTYGHVGVITSIQDLSSNWKITIRGANQPGTQSSEYDCTNVTSWTTNSYPKTWGTNYISYWTRPSVVFSNGFESTNSYQNWVLYSRSVAGYYNSSNPPPEAGRVPFENWATPSMSPSGGSYYLRAAGYSQASYSYVYFKLFDTNIKIQNGMKLRYYIYTYQGKTFSIDGHFTDGNTIRDLYNNGYLTDQSGQRIHPYYQGAYGTGYWRYVEVDLSKARGKTLDYIMFAFDNGNNGFTGKIRAYVDNISITNAP